MCTMNKHLNYILVHESNWFSCSKTKSDATRVNLQTKHILCVLYLYKFIPSHVNYVLHTNVPTYTEVQIYNYIRYD